MIQTDIFRQDSSWPLPNPFTTVKQRNFYMAIISIKTVDNTYMAIIGGLRYMMNLPWLFIQHNKGQVPSATGYLVSRSQTAVLCHWVGRKQVFSLPNDK